MLKTVKIDYVRLKRKPATLAGLIVTYISHPGFKAVCLYRLSNWLYLRRKYKLATIVMMHSVKTTGCEISPGATIGSGLLLHHSVGIVIGGNPVVGLNCTIFQGVTVGIRHHRPGQLNRHPNIGDNVSIGANASILGDIKVGDSATIGAHSLVLASVEPNATIIGIPGHRLIK